MRTHDAADQAMLWQLDAEHEAFRGLAGRSAMRLAVVLAVIVMVIGLALNFVDSADAGDHALTRLAVQTLQADPAAPGFP